MKNKFAMKFRIVLVALTAVCALLAASPGRAGDECQPIDQGRLSVMRAALEHYYSSIQAVHCVFTGKSFSTRDGEATAVPNEGALDQLVRLSDGACRYGYLVRAKDASGTVKEEFRNVTVFDGKSRTTLDYQNKNAGITESSRSTPKDNMDLLLVIGMPVITTSYTRLSSLLRYPEITRICGHETLLGEPVVALTIGPGFPASEVAGHPAWPDVWLKVWLASEKSYLPLRTEIYMPVALTENSAKYYESNGVPVVRAKDHTGADADFYRVLCEVEELRNVPDVARSANVPFPWRVRMTSLATAVSWCEQAEINPAIPADAFSLNIPDDYSLTKNRQPVRVRMAASASRAGNLVRGETDVGASAKAILATPITKESAAKSTWSWWLLGGIAAAAAVSVIVFASYFFKGRSNV